MILATHPAGSPEWHAARAHSIGGSEIGTVCGWSPYETRDELLQRKAGVLDPKPMTDAMRRGNWDELGIVAFLCDTLPATLDHEASAATYVSDDNPRHSYNPDGITTCGLLLEAKSVTDRERWGRGGPRRPGLEVPDHYRAQVVWGLGILGLETCHIGVRHAGNKGRIDNGYSRYLVPFEPNLYRYMRRMADAFIADLDQLMGRAAAA